MKYKHHHIKNSDTHHDGSVSDISGVRRKCLRLWIDHGLLNNAHLSWPGQESFTPAWHMIGFGQQPLRV